MAYVQHEWVAGEVITEALMDHLETQYDEGDTNLIAHRINIGAGDGRHRWTAAKLLRGAGAAAPTEIDVPPTYTSGTYTGDAGADRQIPHGLGSTPKMVLLTGNVAGVLGLCVGTSCVEINVEAIDAVTALDATNFSVSDANSNMNSNLVVYNWVAFA